MIGAHAAERDAAFAVVQDCAVADIASRRTAISHIQLAATMATTRQSREQRFSGPHRPSDCGTALASRIIGDHALVPLELIPGDIAFMLILDQNVPFRLWSAQSALDTLAALLNADLARRTAKSIGASIDRVCQNVVHGVVERQFPDNAPPFAIARFDRQLDALVAQPDMYLTDAL